MHISAKWLANPVSRLMDVRIGTNIQNSKSNTSKDATGWITKTPKRFEVCAATKDQRGAEKLHVWFEVKCILFMFFSLEWKVKINNDQTYNIQNLQYPEVFGKARVGRYFKSSKSFNFTVSGAWLFIYVLRNIHTGALRLGIQTCKGFAPKFPPFRSHLGSQIWVKKILKNPEVICSSSLKVTSGEWWIGLPFAERSGKKGSFLDGPQITCAPQKRSLAPQIKCVHFNKQPFRLGTGGDWGFRGGDRGQGTYTWRCSTMNQQPFRLGTGGGLGF